MKAIISLGLVVLAVMFLFGCTQTNNDVNADKNQALIDQTTNVDNTTNNSTNPVDSETTEVVADPEEVNIGEMY